MRGSRRRPHGRNDGPAGRGRRLVVIEIGGRPRRVRQGASLVSSGRSATRHFSRSMGPYWMRPTSGRRPCDRSPADRPRRGGVRPRIEGPIVLRTSADYLPERVRRGLLPCDGRRANVANGPSRSPRLRPAVGPWGRPPPAHSCVLRGILSWTPSLVPKRTCSASRRCRRLAADTPRIGVQRRRWKW
jgi:hypothetical protein